ncbi:acyltransferase family protein [Limosilactobacillus sp. BG-MG3-A]|uniref:Acyltransferase family protein n=2 Tax=Limosilactobacillus agrestis TaxID=2759748 RepID=A0A7W3UI85_9LACO|nr:acyltransferase family protein [Limosilactobacillus agrestis]MBB1095465.1 acyltransferase family protein [Limosilactobacillus agrestis]
MIIRNKRNSSIELLRILSMFVIVIHHYAYHSTFNWQVYNSQYTGALKVNLFLHFIGKLGVDIFVIIGAYFLCEKRFTFKRPINLILTTMFYSFGIWITLTYVLKVKLLIPLSWRDILLPFPLPSGYWFVYSYVIMLLAMPFLNIIIRALNRAQLIMLIMELIILWSFLVIGFIIFGGKPNTEINDLGFTQTTFFTLLYFIAAYIRKYSGNILNSKKYTAIGSLISLFLVVFCSYLANSQRTFNLILATFDTNGPLVILSSIFIFSFFRNCSLNSEIINYIANSMFGVYLIHEDSFIRPIIWRQLISSRLYEQSGINYLLAGLGYSLLVFIICIIIDIICRRLIFKRVIDNLTYHITKIFNKLEELILHKYS